MVMFPQYDLQSLTWASAKVERTNNGRAAKKSLDMEASNERKREGERTRIGGSSDTLLSARNNF